MALAVWLVAKSFNTKSGDLTPTTEQPTSTITVSDTVNPSITATTNTTQTSTPTNVSQSSPTPAIVSLGKTFSEEVLPNIYSFKYPTNWSEQVRIPAQNKLSVTLGTNSDVTVCANNQVICGIVFNINYPAEMVDESVSTFIRTENINLYRDGTVRLDTYKYNSNNRYYMLVSFSTGYFQAYFSEGKDTEAATMFKQILATFLYDESAF